MPKIGEDPVAPVTEVTPDRATYTANEEQLKNLSGGKSIDEMSDDETQAFLAERKKLKATNADLYDKMEGEARGEHKTFKTAEAQAVEAARLQAEAAARTEQAEQDRLEREEDLAKATTLLETIKSGNLGAETTQTAQAAESGVAAGSERPIEERLEAPETEMSEKYGERIRKAAKELVKVVKELEVSDAKLKSVDRQSAEWQPAVKEYNAINAKRNRLRSEATWDDTILRKQNSGETDTAYHNYQGKALGEYQQTAMQDPVAALALAEAGELSENGPPSEGLGIGRASKELRSNDEYMRRMLDVLDQNSAQSFWAYTIGEARQDKELYLKAVRKNHLNYQFGSKEWKLDPEVQKIALASGLSPMYLQK